MPVRAYSTLQALRGLTALAVVVCHLDFLFDARGVALRLVSHFHLGVDVFFVISGFVIAISTVDRAASRASVFLVRRVFRIVPLAWAVILLVTLLLHQPDPALVARGLLLLPENPSHLVMPLVYPNWTLSYEAFFYGLFGVSLLASHRYRCEVCLALIGALALADALVPASAGALRSFLDAGLLLEFAAGLLIARAILWMRSAAMDRVALWIGGACLGVGAAFGIGRPLESGFFGVGIGAAFLIAGLLAIETGLRLRLPAWLERLGDWSYAIYISQVFAFFVILPAMHGSWLARVLPGPSQLVLFLPATIGIAAALHYAIEKPGIRFGRRVVAWMETSRATARSHPVWAPKSRPAGQRAEPFAL